MWGNVFLLAPRKSHLHLKFMNDCVCLPKNGIISFKWMGTGMGLPHDTQICGHFECENYEHPVELEMPNVFDFEPFAFLQVPLNIQF
jgi:hypothetical protein